MPKITAMEAYKLLPKTNCKECGEQSCMSFALKLVSREKTLGDCPHLKGENLALLAEKLAPPVGEVRFGLKDSEAVLGGEEVMYRHELRFFSPTVLAVDVSDAMDEKEVDKRIAFVKDFEIERVGDKLRLDAIAVRSVSNEPRRFRETVEYVVKRFAGPLILCSFNPKVMQEGLKVCGENKPLLYAADEDNWKEMEELAKKHGCPLTVYSQNLSALGSIASSLDYDKIVLDPGIISAGKGLAETLDRFVMLRKSAIEGVKELGYPVMGAACAVYAGEEDRVVAAYFESVLANMLIDRYASLLVLHSIEPWSILPILTLRQAVYTDPRSEPQVEAKVYTVGNPGENSPVLVTTNFSLTYFTVTGDLRKGGIDCYLVVINTNGFAVDTAVATGDLSAAKIKDAINKAKLEEKVKHKKLVVPLFASHIRGAIEDETGWEVLVGPRDSSGIQKFLQEKWQT